jgi:Zn-dependent M28 family amino/carboxypeptidase
MIIDELAAYMRAVVETLCAVRPFRNYDFPEGLNKAAGLIEGHLPEKMQVLRQSYIVENQVFENIIAIYSAAETHFGSNSKLIIGAHYDVHGQLPGADDNASAVAVLLALLQLLDRFSPILPLTVEAVFYTLEENPPPGISAMGSYQHAWQIRQTQRAHEYMGMICLEMVGYFSQRRHSQQYPPPFEQLKGIYPDTGNFLAVVGNNDGRDFFEKIATGLKAAQTLPICAFLPPADISAEMASDLIRSDHINYIQHQIPAVMLTDTAFLRNPNYHQASDTPDTLDYIEMTKVVEALYHVVINLTVD